MTSLPAQVHSGAVALLRGLPTPVTIQAIEAHLLDIEVEERFGHVVSPAQLLALARRAGLAPPPRTTGRPGRPLGPVAQPYRRSGSGPLHVGTSHTVGRSEPASEVEPFSDAEFVRLALAADEPSRLLRDVQSGNGRSAKARAECERRFRCRITAGNGNGGNGNGAV